MNININIDIKTLDISNQKLTKLPDLSIYPKLRILHCSNNLLTSIDNLPRYIKYIYCSNNKIECINNLPAKLEGLFCTNNKIRYIKYFPLYMSRIFCGKNLLTSLPELPLLLDVLICNKNPLHSLPDIPYTLNYLKCGIIPEIYDDGHYQTINIVNNFRFNYYSLKYGHKLLWPLIQYRMNYVKNKKELLEKGAMIVMNPDRIFRMIDKEGTDISEIYNNL